ncbi:MAG: gfo/Idh/MocA family oxidoreductase [Planctomycetota bacterium]|nr:MAG: gfo/Idh/MocA family oxidoreductase [Planctomycetota bacterium]
MTDPLRLLVVGAGSIGERHARCFAATGRVRLALCEVNADVRKRVAERYAIGEVFDDYQAALAAGPKVVVVATPAHLHVPMAAAAAQAGAHVLIEKPLSTTPAGVDELVELVAGRGVTAGVAYVYRCHPALTAMREALASGRFGEPVEIVANCGQHFPLYRPAYREIYYKDRATGGGAVQDALTHVINAGQWLVGPIDRLAADVDHQVLDGVEVEDTAHVLARHGRVMGCYSLNQHQAPNEVTITVACTGGTVRFEYHANRWRWMTEPGGTWNDEPSAALERDDLFVRQAEMFLDATAGKREPLCTLADARHTLETNLAILRAADSRQWETIAGVE